MYTFIKTLVLYFKTNFKMYTIFDTIKICANIDFQLLNLNYTFQKIYIYIFINSSIVVRKIIISQRFNRIQTLFFLSNNTFLYTYILKNQCIFLIFIKISI